MHMRCDALAALSKVSHGLIMLFDMTEWISTTRQGGPETTYSRLTVSECRELAHKERIPTQKLSVFNDMLCGSRIGPVLATSMRKYPSEASKLLVQGAGAQERHSNTGIQHPQ